MKHEFLDLARHEPDVFAGKAIQLCGAAYVLGNLIAEGGEAYVHPMRNVQSGISWFVAKIYRFRPGSREFEERRLNVGFTSFFLELQGVPFLYTEIHEIHGGSMRLQRNLASLAEPDYHDTLMSNASALAKARQWAEAAGEYRRILERNPHHTPAMLNCSSCLLNLGIVPEALRLLDGAMRIEPNDTEIYRQIAKVFASLGSPAPAIEYLNTTLRRYKWDASTWSMKARIARRFGIDSVLRQMREELRPLETADYRKNGNVLDRFIGELDQSLMEASRRKAAIQATLAIQKNNQWQAALEGWQAIGLENLDQFNLLNALICKFQLARFPELARESGRLLATLRGPAQNAAAVLALIASYNSSEHEIALSFVRFLSSHVRSPVDLPGLPVLVLENGSAVMEARSSLEILQALTGLVGCCRNGNDTMMCKELKAAYEKRAANGGEIVSELSDD